MRRLAPAVILFLAVILPGVALAQTCPPPVVMVVGGTNPSCTGQPVTLDAGPGWATYQWSPGGATTRMISDSPSETATYTVTTTDANGCSVTSQPITVVVNATPAAPAIQLREPTLCGGAQGEASVSGTWSSYAWSVTHGTIAGGSSGASVDYTASGDGPMVVSLTVTDASGCAVTAHADVPLPIAKPTVQTWPNALCPGSHGFASINAPAEGGQWASYHWTVLNGTILEWSGDSSDFVNFNSNASGPVTVQVTAIDSHGCRVTSDPVAIPVRSIAKPTITTWPNALCPGSHGFASINPPADGGQWASYHWTVLNGTILEWSGDSSDFVNFNSNASGPAVTVQVTATDGSGCTATSDPVTIPVRSIAKPTVTTWPNALCPGSHGFASINPPAEGGSSWTSFHWTVLNGTILEWSGNSSDFVNFNSNASGPAVTVQVTATDGQGCTATSDPVTIPVRSIAKPTVTTWPNALCPGSHGFASINPPAESGSIWASYHWTVTNGTILEPSGDSNSSVNFNSNLSGPAVTVQVTATDGSGCTATSDPVTIPVRSIAKPTVTTWPNALCPGSHGFASINPPAESGSIWASYHWTVTHGTILEPSGDSNSSVNFNSDASGQPVTVQVTATDGSGCTATSDPVTIPVSTSTPAINVDTPLTCAGSSAQVSLAPPSDPSVTWQNIQWTVTGGTILDGATSPVMHLQSDPAGGTVVVTVSAQTSQGCSGTASTTLTATAVTPTLSAGPASICAGGSAEADLSGNWSSYQSFHWTVTHATINGVSTNPYVFFTPDGTGDVTATLTAVTVSGCTGTASVTYRLGGPDATITAPASDSFCVNSPITASVPDAGPGASYQWTINGSQVFGAGRTLDFNPSTTSIQLGVTVSLNGCSSSGSKSLTGLAAPQATLSAPSHICYLSTGNTATLSDPGPGVTIEWPPNTAALRVTPTADPRVAHFDSVPYQYFNGDGAIVVKLTNASGCVSYVVALLKIDVPYAVASPAGTTTFCQGGSVTIYGGPFGTGYSFLWSNGATTQSIDATQSGSYSVTVIDPAGCSLTSSAVNVTVNTTATPTITANGRTTFCGTGSVTLTSSAGASYSWSNGATTQSVTVSTSGSYTVTVTGASGCSATSAATVVTGNTPPPTPTITVFSPTTFCAGGSVTLFASSASGYSYAWSNGATTSSIVATTAGAYSVIVTDANGCSATSAATTVTVNPAPPAPAVTASGPTAFCQGGSVTLTAPAGYTYSWSNGATTQSITVSQSGVYSVTVRNASGCTATSTGTIVNVDPIPTPFITPSGPTEFCAGGSVTLTTGSGYASYLWSNGATTQSINVTASGSYSVTTTDSSGCSGTTAATTVTVDPAPSAVVTVGGATTFCAGGSVNLFAPNGLSYTWSNGATTQSIHVTTTGAYSVTTRNFYGCTATSTPTVVTVTDNPPKPTVTAGGPTTFCAGGSVTLTASAGSSYQWTNGMTTQSINVTTTGNYYVAVYDVNGCGTASDPVSVTVNPRPVATITFSPPPSSFCDGGQPIVLTSSLGASYLWSTGQTTRSVSFNQAGTYNVTVTVTGANGCSATSQPQPFIISPLPPATITANGPTTFCAPGSVLLTAPNPGSQSTDGPYTYQWSTGATTSSITAAQSGSYSVTVTNRWGCSATSAPTVVTANPPPPATITASGPTSFCTPGSVTLSAPAGAGFTYHWTNGATTQSINATTTDFYNVTVTSAAGCSATGSPVFVLADPGPAATITPSGPTSFCAGIGSVTLSAPGGSYTYLWSTGATTSSINVTTSGSYSVTVTDVLGCSTTSAPTVVSANALPPQPTITASGPATFCTGGSVTLTAPAGYTYFWGTGDHTQSIVVSNSGGYQVTIRDANGCQSMSAVVNVTVNPLPATPAISAGGPTTFCAGGSVTLTAPAGYTYSWSNGATTQAINATTSGSYSVTITNANGCSANSAATVVTVNAPPATPAITASGPTTFCAGGSVTLTAPGGYTYLWTGGWTTQSISVGSSGSYSVTVRDANGCSSASTPIVVTVMAAPPAPMIDVTPSGMICEGTTATLTAPAGYSYLWSNGATTQSITSSTTGSFNVTVTNANGCSATSQYTAYVSVFPVPPVPVLTPSGPTTFCSGGSVTLTAPTGYTNYIWSDGNNIWVNGSGSPANAITVFSSGSYTVQARGDNFCYSTSAPTVVTVNSAPPVPAITASGPTAFCAGGSVTLTASSAASYLWSTGATTASIVASTSGSYTVTVTNASGCSSTSAPTIVTAKANPTAAITVGGPTTFCAGGNVTLTASSGTSYLWSTGATTASIVASTSGSYSVTVTGANGCSATSSPTVVTVNANPTASITAGGPTTFCAGGSVTLTASSGSSYLWSNGATTSSIVASTSGSYTVTVTNANGCSTASSPTAVTVNANPTASITAGGPTTFCAGGSVTLTASSGSSYLWSTGATTSSIVASSSGNYTVAVTNANGCSTTSSTAVTVNANPTASITAGGPTTFCAGGSVTLTASSGTSYLWSTGATTASIVVSASGSYSVTVTNASGCSTTSSPTVVTANANPTASITAGGPTTFCAGGNVTLTASSGVSYLWSTGATTASIIASASGSYSVTVTNANGCSAASSPTVVTANANPTASITAGGPTTFCSGGSVTLTASSGSSYLWSTGATTSSIVASTSGSYTVTVTNANGCSTTSSPTAVTVNANPTATITAGGPTTFCAGGNVTLTASSGTSYLWSTGATTSSIVASTSGSYTVTVTNASGCSTTSSPTVVTANASPTASITAGGPTTFCAGGNVTLTASSGTSYLWSTGATTASIIASTSGSYSVTVTNANGCSATSSPTAVTVNANPTASITAGGPTTFCAGGNVTLTASSGTSYLWSTGATTSSIVASSSGSYTVTITNASGCSTTSSPTVVTANVSPTASITAGGPTTFCTGGNVTLTASSGASYLWSTGATTASIVASSTGNYSVTVTDANGCSATSAPTPVTVNANPTASITAGGPTTFCTGGSVTLTASSGASYFWSNGETTASIIVSGFSGTYTVTVTNANGCSATSSPTTVTVRPNPTPGISSGQTTFCAGGSVTLTASGGTSYLWSTGATTPSISVSSSGNYSATVTDANGCSAITASVPVTVNPNPAATITPSGPTALCTGGSVTLTASSGASYLWSTGATTSSIAVSSAGNYSVTVTNASGCSNTSAPLAVTVRAKPTAVVSGGGSICPGGSTTITATLTGVAPWSVTWSDGNIQTINSGTTATRSVSPASTTIYTVSSLSDATCTGTSSGSATVTVKTLPTAVVSGGGTICPGASATITATLTGTAPWSVTWSDGNIQTINSGTTATRSVSPASTTVYTVTSVSDAKSCPSAGTGSATVTRNAAASITTQPVNQTTTRNTNVTLSVVAAGTAPLSYQWFKGNGTTISGATSSTYTTSFPNKGNNTFYVEVWNACNTTHVKSTTVTVTVN
jgi:enoyl-CoA hydratase/carnithine racemase